jgi:cytochrome d ubiquinol oxidase subunit I
MTAATLATIVVGHFDAQLMTRQQPMKMAAAEALWNTEKGAGLSLVTIAPFEKKPHKPTVEIKIPNLAALMATNNPNGTVKGINQVQDAEVAKYGPGEYYPIVGLTYWTFRLMMGAGGYMVLIGLVGLIGWKRKIYERRWFSAAAVLVTVAGFSAHLFGWMFTEVGRQPWVVYGLQKTADAVSQLGAGTVLTSLLVFVALYGVLAFIEARLFLFYVRKGPDADHVDSDGALQVAITY